MANAVDAHQTFTIIDCIENPIVSSPYSVAIMAHQFLGTGRSGIIGEITQDI
jgi:hypothetical protein